MLSAWGKDDDGHGASSKEIALEPGQPSDVPPKDVVILLCPLPLPFAPDIGMSDGYCWNHPRAKIHDSAVKPILCGNLWYKGVQRGVGAHPSHCCPKPQGLSWVKVSKDGNPLYISHKGQTVLPRKGLS